MQPTPRFLRFCANVFLFLTLPLLPPATAAQGTADRSPTGTSSEHSVEQLERTVADLQAEVTELKAQMVALRTAIAPVSVARTVAPVESTHTLKDIDSPGGGPSGLAVVQEQSLPSTAPVPSSDSLALSKEDRGILDYLKGSTTNVLVDGYYEYNFNNPVGRVNALRAYDVSSNAFSLNQAAIVFERATDPEAGRRWGTRVDLQFGQATATLGGNPSNEHRPDLYRNIFQAFGTYIFPVGSGLTVDFGKWASSLGYEGNYTKDQMNYSRAYWFNFLPFYHMGFRVKYQVNDKLAINYWLVNGTNQTEPTNGFKDEMFGFVLTPNKKITWTTNYYFGQENPDAVGTTNCPPVPLQPGLCFVPVVPAPNGKLHIFDSYAAWVVNSRWTLGLEGDYVINRMWASSALGQNSAPAHTWGGAAYVQYLLTPRTFLAGRTEYLEDRGSYFTGGLFSNMTEALKEFTVTYGFNVSDGLQVKTEYRYDWSNVPVFLTAQQNVFSKDQSTATLGLIWWFGRKQGAW